LRKGGRVVASAPPVFERLLELTMNAMN